MIEYEIRTTGTCEKLEDLPAGATILEVDGKTCIGRCEACGKPILEGEKHYSDEEGVELCAPCMEEYRASEEHEERRVTHEMALDAGDPSLEGTPY